MKKSIIKSGKNKKIKEFKINFDIKTVCIVIFSSFFLYTLFGPVITESMKNSEEVPLTQILQDIKEDKVKKVLVEDNKVTATYADEKTLVTRKESRDSFRQILNDNEIPLEQVVVETKDSTLAVEILRVLGSIIPIVLLFAFFWFVI